MLLTYSLILHIAVDQESLDVPAFVGDGPGHAMPHAEMPLTESLQDTFHRLLPLWHDSIAPAIKSGKRVLIVAHGNSIRVRITYRTDCHVTIVSTAALPQYKSMPTCIVGTAVDWPFQEAGMPPCMCNILSVLASLSYEQVTWLSQPASVRARLLAA